MNMIKKKPKRAEGNTDQDHVKLGTNGEVPYKMVKLVGKGAYYLEDSKGKCAPRLWNSDDLTKIISKSVIFLTKLVFISSAFFI